MSKLSKMRDIFHKIINPFILFLVKLKITPNMVTTSSLFFLGITIYFIFKQNLILAAIFMILTSVIDSLDGALAKKVGSTKFGDFYDAFIDRWVEVSVFYALSLAYPLLYHLCFLALVFSLMTSYVAARAEVWTIGVKIKYVGSIGSRAGRLITLITAMLFNQLYIGLILIIIFASITMVARTAVVVKTLRKKI
ncbi:MAG: CDP-alcohol phosphatidyltransferase family protein [Candidatus Nanoarchaeia archaeon]|nr:CDP-alcohol phosphatidyltransferase family protein [Candidatus Nanoarchaeia archaeon]